MGASEKNPGIELNFYKHFLKDHKFKISQSILGKFSTYVNMMQSKIIIGMLSTSLREAFIFKKKVLACNFTGHKSAIFPSKGLCAFSRDTTYNNFKNRVLTILEMPHKKYRNRLSKETDYIMNSKIDTANFIRSRIKKILK